MTNPSISINVNVSDPAVLQALLAGLGVTGSTAGLQVTGSTSAPNIAPSSPTPTVAPAAPAPVAQAAPAPVAPAPAAPVPVLAPTVSTPEYSMDDLARASVTLRDSGKLAQLQGLLSKYNVRALTELPKAQYGAFAVDLRGLGAVL